MSNLLQNPAVLNSASIAMATIGSIILLPILPLLIIFWAGVALNLFVGHKLEHLKNEPAQENEPELYKALEIATYFMCALSLAPSLPFILLASPSIFGAVSLHKKEMEINYNEDKELFDSLKKNVKEPVIVENPKLLSTPLTHGVTH
jgi:flagellar biosynthesis component FlhA